MSANRSQPPALGASPGSLLRQYRLAAGMTQKQLARPLFSPSYISTVERGKAKPSLKLLTWCADQLKVSVAELLGNGTSIYDRSQRQRLAESAYEQAHAEMLFAAGEIHEAGTRLRAIHRRAGQNAPKMMLWLSAYVAYAEGDLERARAELVAYGSPPPTGENPLEAAAYRWLRGLIAGAEGALGRAVTEHTEALGIGATSFIAPDFAIGVRATLAETYLRARQLEQAYVTQSEALRLYEQLSNPLRQANEARRLADEAARAHDFVRAYRLARWADTMYREARTMRQVYDMCLRHALSPAPSAAGQAPERDLHLALTIAQRLDLAAECVLATALLALIRVEQGDVKQAKRYAQEGLSGGSSAMGQQAPVVRAVVTLAHAALAQATSHKDEAREGLDRAHAALVEAGDVSETDFPLLLFGYEAAVRLADALHADEVSKHLMRRVLKLRESHGL